MSRAIASALLLAGVLTPFGGKAHRKTEEGNRLYLEGAHEDALRSYTEAQVAAPESPELHYDIGNVLFRQGNFDGAEEEFRRALLSAPPSLVPDAAYNLGNALYAKKEYKDAVQAYRRTLEKRPADQEAKRNLELALRALRQEQQQKKQQQQKQNEPQDQQQDQQKQQQSGQGQEDPDQKKDQPPSDDQNQSDDQKQGDPKDQKRKDAGDSKGAMTAEEAEKMLERLGDQERENLRREAKRKAENAHERNPEKDW